MCLLMTGEDTTWEISQFCVLTTPQTPTPQLNLTLSKSLELTANLQEIQWKEEHVYDTVGIQSANSESWETVWNEP